MAYRDDVDALYMRASSLQAEVDRLQAELDRTRTPAAPPAPTRFAPPQREVTLPPMRPRPIWLPAMPAGEDPEDAISLLHHLNAATPPATLPSAPPQPSARLDTAPMEVGVLVARLTAVEHALVTRLLQLLADDDFSAAAVRHNTAVFDQLVVELRERLARPA